MSSAWQVSFNLSFVPVEAVLRIYWLQIHYSLKKLIYNWWESRDTPKAQESRIAPVCDDQFVTTSLWRPPLVVHVVHVVYVVHVVHMVHVAHVAHVVHGVHVVHVVHMDHKKRSSQIGAIRDSCALRVSLLPHQLSKQLVLGFFS